MRQNLLGKVQVWAIAAVATLSLGVASLRAADTYELDPAHTSITFKITHLKISTVNGRFNNPTGKFVIDSNLEKSSLNVEVAAESVDTGISKRDEHLRSPDFFDLKKFPKISFESTAFKATATGFAIDGKITLHGVTKPVTITLTKTGEGKDPWGGFRVGYETTFKVNRSDYGMDYMQGVVGDEVTLTVNIEAVKK